jgi:hypothetical protein
VNLGQIGIAIKPVLLPHQDTAISIRRVSLSEAPHVAAALAKVRVWKRDWGFHGMPIRRYVLKIRRHPVHQCMSEAGVMEESSGELAPLWKKINFHRC